MAQKKSPYDYGADAEVPHEADIGRLSQLARDQFAAEQEVKRVEEALKKAKGELRDIQERDIPELMAAIGVAEFATTAGLRIKIKRIIRASIPVAQRPRAYKWLDDHGHSGMIKRTVRVGFNRDEQEAADELVNELRPKFENVAQDQKVEPATLRGFIREQIDAGKTVPMALFGAEEVRQAKIETIA